LGCIVLFMLCYNVSHLCVCLAGSVLYLGMGKEFTMVMYRTKEATKLTPNQSMQIEQ